MGSAASEGVPNRPRPLRVSGYAQQSRLDPPVIPPLPSTLFLTLPMTRLHLHLVSDATGETIKSVAKACLVQFEGVEPIEHIWSLIRTPGQLERVIRAVTENPGVVMYTLVDQRLRDMLEASCRGLNVPCISVLDPVLDALSSYLGAEHGATPGRQHVLDAEYFTRMDAMNYVMSHDDGQIVSDLESADIILVGVSRTSKTPTCIYLANRGYKAANIPILLDRPLPERLFELKKPLIVGLTEDPERLVALRRNRLRMLNETKDTDYADIEKIRAELAHARKVCLQHKWPIIDVTRRSIEETAAAILQLYDRRAGRIT